MSDHAVVERILGGEWTMHSGPAEKAEVCRRWHASGGSLKALGNLTGWRVARHFRIDAQEKAS